uniref:Putative ovule protein n=1 Tax=Solanum chacoense TaxID=4108 RepID=A0A0V0GHE8_SOLCH
MEEQMRILICKSFTLSLSRNLSFSLYCLWSVWLKEKIERKKERDFLSFFVLFFFFPFIISRVL